MKSKLIPKNQNGNNIQYFSNLDNNDWSLNTWDAFSNRVLKNSRIQSIDSHTERDKKGNFKNHMFRHLETTPERDSVWIYTQTNPEKELHVFKNSKTNDYIYNYTMPGRVEDYRVTQLPDYIKKLITWDYKNK